MSTFNELIDFTRSTTGTYLDSVVYGDELVTNGDFASDSDWAKQVSANWTISGGKLNGANSTGWIKQNGIVENGKAYKITVDAIVSGGSFRMVTTADGSTYTSYITSSGSYVFYIRPLNALSGGFEFIGNGFTGSIDNISVKELTGGQVSGTPLLRTAAINEPRLEYDASGNPLGLLIEEARANQAKHSEDWTLYPWTLRENSFSSSTNSIAPDGTAGATRFYTNSNVPAFLQQGCGGNVGAKTHTVSCWVRSTNGGADQTFRLKCTHSGVTDFFSNDKTATSEWKRFTFTETFISASNTAVIAGVVEDSSINQFDIEVWGMQVEFDASFPTSYIPTSGSTVTRAADFASLPVERFAYNQAQGSLVFYSKLFAEDNTSQFIYALSAEAGNSNNTIRLYDSGTDNRLISNIRTNAANVATFNIDSTAFDSPFKVFQSYKVNDFSAGIDGAVSGVDTGGAVPVNIKQWNFFSAQDSGSVASGHIKQIQYYPKRLSNTELQLLTQPSASPTMNLTFDGQATSTLVEGLHD